MKIDGTRVVPGSARMFSAIGGDHGVKLTIARKNGEAWCDGSVPREFLLGSFAQAVAEQIVRRLNAMKPTDDVSSSSVTEPVASAA